MVRKRGVGGKCRRAKVNTRPEIVVRPAPARPNEARIIIAGNIRKAAIGRSGTTTLKKEGDGATPVGAFALREVIYRRDRMLRPRTPLPVRPLHVEDGWCEDPKDRNYNRRVRLPYSGASVDRLTRADDLYDLVVVLGYNDRPRVKGRGSAIFMHLARPGYTPTAGCIALSRRDLLLLLKLARPGAKIRVTR